VLRPRSLLLAIAVVPALCFPVTAHAKEKEVWACQSIEIAGLKWKNGNWSANSFTPQTLLLTIDGVNSTWKSNDIEFPATCVENRLYTSCSDSFFGAAVLVLNKEDRIASYSDLLGGVTRPSNDGRRDSLHVGSYSCTKF
jgi:hypothetical protein